MDITAVYPSPMHNLLFAFFSFFTLALLFSILIGIVIGYYLGRHKTQNPAVAALLGGLFGLFPPLVLIYLTVLLLKNDITPSGRQ